MEGDQRVICFVYWTFFADKTLVLKLLLIRKIIETAVDFLTSSPPRVAPNIGI